jgi:hypothetical protein
MKWEDVDVEIDTHRWYSEITITTRSGLKRVVVIGDPDRSGLVEFDSVEDFRAAC